MYQTSTTPAGTHRIEPYGVGLADRRCIICNAEGATGKWQVCGVCRARLIEKTSQRQATARRQRFAPR